MSFQKSFSKADFALRRRIEFNVFCQPWLLGKLEDSMNGCQFHTLLDVKLQVSVVNNVFFFFPEIWNKFWFFAEFYAEFFYEVQCIFREVLLHRTLFHCEWVVIVIIMQMCRVFQVHLQEIPNFVMRLEEVQVKNFILVIRKLNPPYGRY